MQLQSCMKYELHNDHTLLPEKSCEYIKEKTESLVDAVIKIKTKDYPFLSIMGTLPSKKFHRIVGTKYPSGKGYSETEALNSALFELGERYSFNETIFQTFTIKTIAQMGVLLEDIYQNYLPSQLEYLRFPTVLPYLPLKWTEFFDLRGNRVLIPYELFLLTIHGSNGIAAGNTIEEAILHGIHEVIERHCMTIAIEDTVVLNLIDHSTLMSPYLPFYTNVKIADISFLDVPTVLGVLKKGNTDYPCIAGCAGTKKEAVNRLLSEWGQLDVSVHCVTEGYPRYKGSSTLMHHFLRDPTVFPKTPEKTTFEVDDTAKWDIKEEIETLQQILSKHNMTIYWKNITGSLGVPSVIVFIQGTKMNLLPNLKYPFSYFHDGLTRSKK